MSIPLICTDCQATSTVLRVTAGIKCGACGSSEVDLDDKTAVSDQSHHNWVAAPGTFRMIDPDAERSEADESEDAYDKGLMHGFDHENLEEHSVHLNPRWNKPHEIDAFRSGHARAREMRADRDSQRKEAASPGTGWTHTQPDPLANWNEYAGPTPGPNENVGRKTDADDTDVCPVCHGTKTDPRASGGGYEEIVCRNCHGTGRVTNTTGQPAVESLDAHKPGPVPLGGGWQGRSARYDRSTSDDFNGSDKPYWKCPDCGENNFSHGNKCNNCGERNRKQSVKVVIDGKEFEATATVDYAADTSKLDKMAAKIAATNPGLTEKECRVLAGRALDRFPERVR